VLVRHPSPEALREPWAGSGQQPVRHVIELTADLPPGNLLVHKDQLAVIDFDDAGFGWHHYDLAVALVHSQTDSQFC